MKTHPVIVDFTFSHVTAVSFECIVNWNYRPSSYNVITPGVHHWIFQGNFQSFNDSCYVEHRWTLPRLNNSSFQGKQKQNHSSNRKYVIFEGEFTAQEYVSKIVQIAILNQQHKSLKNVSEEKQEFLKGNRQHFNY